MGGGRDHGGVVRRPGAPRSGEQDGGEPPACDCPLGSKPSPILLSPGATRTKNRTRPGRFLERNPPSIPIDDLNVRIEHLVNTLFKWFQVHRLDFRRLAPSYYRWPNNDAWMADDHEGKRVPTMSSTGQIESESPSSNEELAAATDGDPAARWRALEACRDYLRLVARRGRWTNGGGRPATSDLVQGTVVEAWRQFSKFRGRSPAQLRAWLRAILIHASLNARRRPSEAHIGSGRGGGSRGTASTSPSQAAHKKDSREALDAAIVGLMEHHRTIIRLRIWEQLSFVADRRRLGISEDAAPDALRRLRGRWRSSANR